MVWRTKSTGCFFLQSPIWQHYPIILDVRKTWGIRLGRHPTAGLCIPSVYQRQHMYCKAMISIKRALLFNRLQAVRERQGQQASCCGVWTDWLWGPLMMKIWRETTSVCWQLLLRVQHNSVLTLSVSQFICACSSSKNVFRGSRWWKRTPDGIKVGFACHHWHCNMTWSKRMEQLLIFDWLMKAKHYSWCKHQLCIFHIAIMLWSTMHHFMLQNYEFRHCQHILMAM